MSAYPPAVTAQMVQNFLRGGAAVNVLDRELGAQVAIADLGVAAELAGEWLDAFTSYWKERMTALEALLAREEDHGRGKGH